jgi:hypothetical protein
MLKGWLGMGMAYLRFSMKYLVYKTVVRVFENVFGIIHRILRSPFSSTDRAAEIPS